jgi:tetratricopeptide (TPR) repeat protein
VAASTERRRRAAGRRTRSTDPSARCAARFYIRAAFALGFSIIFSSGAAIAETISPACPERPADATKVRDTAKTWFRKGEALVKEELYAEALGAFNCSLRWFEHPATMMNAARAAELAGNKAEALDLYRRAVAATPEAGKATWAQERIAALEKELGSATDPEKTPEEKPEPAIEPKPEPEPQIAPKPEPSPEKGSSEGGSMLLAPGYAAVVVGGVGIVLGTVLAGLAAKAKKDGEATSSYEVFKDKQSKLEGMQTGAIVSFAVGGAALVAGIVMIAVGRKGEKPSDTPVYPGVGGLAVGGTF